MKTYCTQNKGDCKTCSLVNYGRDCRNNPVEAGTPDDVMYYKPSWRKYQKAFKKGLDERGI